jgi:hypothetical protein
MGSPFLVSLQHSAFALGIARAVASVVPAGDPNIVAQLLPLLPRAENDHR